MKRLNYPLPDLPHPFSFNRSRGFLPNTCREYIGISLSRVFRSIKVMPLNRG